MNAGLGKRWKLLSAAAAVVAMTGATGSAQAHGDEEPAVEFGVTVGSGYGGYGGYGYNPHQELHGRIEQRHDNTHDRLDAQHEAYHYFNGNRNDLDHQLMHRQQQRQHQRAHRRLNNQHDRFHWGGGYGWGY